MVGFKYNSKDQKDLPFDKDDLILKNIYNNTCDSFKRKRDDDDFNNKPYKKHKYQ